MEGVQGRSVDRPAGRPCPGLRQRGGGRRCEALPEWTEIFSSAHKGLFSLPQHNIAGQSDMKCANGE